jgi:hypothetical protein
MYLRSLQDFFSTKYNQFCSKKGVACNREDIVHNRITASHNYVILWVDDIILHYISVCVGKMLLTACEQGIEVFSTAYRQTYYHTLINSYNATSSCHLLEVLDVIHI